MVVVVVVVGAQQQPQRAAATRRLALPKGAWPRRILYHAPPWSKAALLALICDVVSAASLTPRLQTALPAATA